MSSLTEQERLGLEEVFLSITSKPKYASKFIELSKNLCNLLKRHATDAKALKPVTAFYHMQKRIKSPISGIQTPKKEKKKRNLS